MGLIALAPLAPAARPMRAQPAEPSRALAPATNGDGMNVLILGDSLALCGFGKRLDERFRALPETRAVFSYMACGTNPLSWLKQKPYTSIKTQCGYWSIESEGAGAPQEMQDSYGMTRGHVPKPYPVPKLDDMLNDLHPDVLIMQTGGNLFGLFPDAKTVHAAQHAAALHGYLTPFKNEAIAPTSTLKKIYWVNPPFSGRVSKEVQDFLFDQTRKQFGAVSTVIDSRALVSYPYHHMDADKEHFIGEDMTLWADRVFDLIQRDLAAQPLASLKPLAQRGETALALQTGMPNETPARAEAVVQSETPARAEAITRATPANIPAPTAPSRNEPLLIKATLVFKSEPMPLNELLPYQESLVAYVYNVDKVVKGRYDERQILVMRPAHIALKPQKLKDKIGKRYKLRLDHIEGTLWETAKARDESGQINLQPYIQVEDKMKHPGSRGR